MVWERWRARAAPRTRRRPDPEPVPQGGDMLRHHGLGEMECPRRRREAAERRDADENLHAGHAVEHGAMSLPGCELIFREGDYHIRGLRSYERAKGYPPMI